MMLISMRNKNNVTKDVNAYLKSLLLYVRVTYRINIWLFSGIFDIQIFVTRLRIIAILYTTYLLYSFVNVYEIKCKLIHVFRLMG